MNSTRTQFRTQRRLLPSFERRLAELNKDWLVSGEQLLQIKPDDLRVGVRPDLYLLPCRPSLDTFSAWPAFQPGVPAPIFALEIVSETNWDKDYVSAPQRYALLGVDELVLFDPMVIDGTSPASEPVILQLYRRSLRGTMVRVSSGAGPLFLRSVEAWLHVEGDELKLCRDQAGRDLVMTYEQAERWWKERAEAEAQARQQAETLVLAESKARQQAETLARAAMEERQQAEAFARAATEARQQAEALARSENEARQQAEALARSEAQARQQAEILVLAEGEARQKAEALAHAETARAEVERQAKEAAEEKVRAAQQASEQQAEAARLAALRERSLAREALVDLCDLLGLPLDRARQAQLEAATTEELLALRSTLKASRRWPEG
jgi:hypothetical protein